MVEDILRFREILGLGVDVGGCISMWVRSEEL